MRQELTRTGNQALVVLFSVAELLLLPEPLLVLVEDARVVPDEALPEVEDEWDPFEED